MSIKDLAGINSRLQKRLSQLDQNHDGSLDRTEIESTPSFLATLKWPLQDRIDVAAALVSSGLQGRLGYARQLFQFSFFIEGIPSLMGHDSQFESEWVLWDQRRYLDKYACVLRWNARDAVNFITDRCPSAPIESAFRLFPDIAPGASKPNGFYTPFQRLEDDFGIKRIPLDMKIKRTKP